MSVSSDAVNWSTAGGRTGRLCHTGRILPFMMLHPCPTGQWCSIRLKFSWLYVMKFVLSRCWSRESWSGGSLAVVFPQSVPLWSSSISTSIMITFFVELSDNNLSHFCFYTILQGKILSNSLKQVCRLWIMHAFLQKFLLPMAEESRRMVTPTDNMQRYDYFGNILRQHNTALD